MGRVGTGEDQSVVAGQRRRRRSEAAAADLRSARRPGRATGSTGADYDWTIATSDLRGRGRSDLVVRDRDGYLARLDGTRSGYGAPRTLGEAGGYDLGG